ncbi:aminotransferase class I/II-fold pyridoxal phosphate-dependent enzyme [Klebsiella aerogenes]|uniref:aminotransferase class I/II-fold pyridoxal phosphate-dependent enzyme n=1 Tax=Enterobacterales TaxID=91347 RepID=UPI000F84DC4B|nr:MULTISPECIES: aminotransferase class I/II-fold pyridoxal phosphate-dependent enzyme [Enterobacterales]KAA8672723.1 histidinol-phosphate aminotransferase family protein [Pantoea dispersa]MBT2090686.1 aminotransferase class I/II-fold pyridoxal phosphate-dependent enzyme [Enterobacter bugandensis]RTQ02468.1 histidinol-phosphate aminotransferase family protein [Enterobacter sp. WCHEn045836]
MIKFDIPTLPFMVKKESKRNFINLKSNENLTGDLLRAEMSSLAFILSSEDIYKYPVYDEIYAKASLYTGTQNILLTSGGHDAIRIVLSSLSKNNKALLTAPNYNGYELYFSLYKIPYLIHMRGPEEPHNLDELVSRAKHNKCNLIVITNPDPYSGDFFDNETLASFIQCCDAKGISVIIDEVYTGLGKEPHTALTDIYDNLILINSFAKSFGLPGLRAGWIVAQDKYLLRLRNHFPETNLSGLSIKILLHLLDRPLVLQHYRDNLRLCRRNMIIGMKKVNDIIPYENSVANFILFKSLKNVSANRLWETLKEKGFYVANLNSIEGYENYFRITVCSRHEYEGLLNELSRI